MPAVTKTIGSTGDYATIQLWIDDLDNAGVYSASDDAVGELQNEDHTISADMLWPNEGETIGLATAKLTVVAGAEHNGVVNAGARILFTTTAQIDIDADFPITLEKFEVDYQGNADRSFVQAGGPASQQIDIHRVMLHNMTGSLASFDGLLQTGSSRTHYLTNNIVFDLTQTAGGDQNITGINGNSTDSHVLNNTVYNIINNSSTGTVICCDVEDDIDSEIRNNIAMNPGGSSSGTKNCYLLAGYINAPFTKCLSSDATGTSGLTSKTDTDEFTDPGSDDFTLKSSAASIDTGDDLGTTETVNIDAKQRDRDFQDDIWDLGALERVSGGPTFKPASFDQSMVRF